MTLHWRALRLLKMSLMSLAILAGSAYGASPDKPSVLVSIKPIELIFSAIAGEEIELDVLLDGNASPHTYHLKPSDVERLTKTDALVWIGPSMESFLTQVILSTKPKQTLALMKHPQITAALRRTSTASAHMEPQQENHKQAHAHSHNGHDHTGPDAHLWLSPRLAVVMAEVAVELFSELAPQHQTTFTRRLEAFRQNLADAEQQALTSLAPVKERGFIVTHDGYGYFVSHFGLNQVAALAISPDRQPGARHIAQLRLSLEKAKARCLLLEPQLRPSYVASLVNGLDVRQQVVDPLGTGIEPNEDGYGTFIVTMASNVRQCLE